MTDTHTTASGETLTRWVVITGAPCAGKTAVIRRLAKMGYPVVHEAARAYIESHLEKGRSLAEVKSDIHRFETAILQRKWEAEGRLDPRDRVFLDRAVPDSIAYFAAEGLDTAAPLARSRRFRYARVFLFDRLAFEKDAVRSEDDAFARRLERLLASAYSRLGYDVIRVPVMPVPQRAGFVLRRLGPAA